MAGGWRENLGRRPPALVRVARSATLYCAPEMLRGVDPDQRFGIFADYFDHETGLSLSHRAKLQVRAPRDAAV